MAESKVAHPKQALTLQERRAFMKLPLEERRRQLAEQANRMARYYTVKEELSGRQEWQGGDIVEC